MIGAWIWPDFKWSCDLLSVSLDSNWRYVRLKLLLFYVVNFYIIGWSQQKDQSLQCFIIRKMSIHKHFFKKFPGNHVSIQDISENYNPILPSKQLNFFDSYRPLQNMHVKFAHNLILSVSNCNFLNIGKKTKTIFPNNLMCWNSWTE